jgi:hypothetical protein
MNDELENYTILADENVSLKAPTKPAAVNKYNLVSFWPIALVGLLLMTACSRTPQASQSAPTHDVWHQFKGTWIAAGNRDSIPFGQGRRASIAKLEGSLVLEGESRPAVGFQSVVVVLNDTATGLTGRATWTDERGDQIFSELSGTGTTTGNKIVGKFLGGTGRYSGASGDYEFLWRFVLEAEDGTVQGQSMGLNGKIRGGPEQSPSDAGGPR